jgi:hypothetical protein
MTIEEDLREERKAHDALVKAGGQPSHPVDLGFNVLDSPGQYEDIISYWKRRAGRCLFLPQLNDWKEFRKYQQEVRHYYIPRNSFPEYQQKVLERRRRHGLQGNIKLCEEPDRESRLQNWTEFQDYNLQILEELEKELKAREQELDSARKELKEVGAVEPDGAFESNLYGLALEQDKQRLEAHKEMKAAEKRAQLAEEGLETAKSHGSRDADKRAALINLAEKEVKSAQEALADCKAACEKVKVRGKVLGVQGRLTGATTKLRWHRIFLVWIEQQRRVRASEDPTSAQDIRGDGNRFKKARSSRCSKGKEKRPPTCSILSPIHGSGISKKSVPSRQQRIIACTSHEAEKASNHRPSKPTSKPARGSKRMPLGPMHSSKISKDNRLRNKKEGKPGLQQSRSANAPLRKSLRTRRKPERFS